MMWQMMTDNVRKIEVRDRHTCAQCCLTADNIPGLSNIYRRVPSFSGYKDRNELWAANSHCKVNMGR